MFDSVIQLWKIHIKNNFKIFGLKDKMVKVPFAKIYLS